MMTAVGALMVHDATVFADYAERSAALSFDVLQGLVEAFDKRIHASSLKSTARNTCCSCLKVVSWSDRATSEFGKAFTGRTHTVSDVSHK